MEVYREIIDGRKLIDIINIPKEFVNTKLEIIVLPFVKEIYDKRINNKKLKIKSDVVLPEIFYNPIKVDQYLNINRKEIYENV